AAPDQERVTLRLEPGTSSLVVKINNGAGPSSFYFQSLGDVVPAEIRRLLTRDAMELTADELAALSSHYREKVWPLRRELEKEIDDLRRREDELRRSAPTSMVLEDQESPRPTYVLHRGHYASPIQDEVIE